MKRLVVMVLVPVLCFGGTVGTFASLSDFSDDVRQEEKENSSRRSGSSRSSSSSSSSTSKKSSSVLDDVFGDIFGELMCIGMNMVFNAWVDFNILVRYASYPYENSRPSFVYYYRVADDKASKKPVIRPLLEHKAAIDLTAKYPTETTRALSSNRHSGSRLRGSRQRSSRMPESAVRHERSLSDYGKFYYFEIDGGGDWCRDEGNGFHVALRGKIFPLLGPECEYRRIIDGDDHLDYYGAGINIPVFQSFIISPDVYAQSCGMRGILERNGFAYGVHVSSYPIFPLVLNVRVGQQIYENIKFIGAEGRAGIMLNRFELYGGWRQIRSRRATLEGGVFGIKVFF